jgi:hypothetical protein
MKNQKVKKTSKVSKKKAATMKHSVKNPVCKPLTWAEVFRSEQLPPLPHQLPAMIETTISQTPELLKGTVAQAVPVAYSIYPSNLSFVYIDGRIRELRMNCLLAAPEGGGKECITLPIKHIMADAKARDIIDRARLKKFNEEWNRSASTKDKPKRPTDLRIQWLHADITRPRLNQAVEDSPGVFLFLKINEIEAWDKVEGASGKNNSFSIMKQADDEDNDFGQDRVGAQSVNADGCLRLNWVADTTFTKLKKYFRYIHGEGPISRITMGGIPLVDIGAPIPVFGKYDKKYDNAIRPFIENLKKATGLIVCKEAQKMIEKLKAEIDEFTTFTQDRILDSLSHRALVAAFRKACLIYVANGMKWEPIVIENYCRWSMQMDLYLKYKLFVDDIRDANDGVKMSKHGPQSLLDKVTADEQGVFVFDEVMRIYTAEGKEPDEKKVRNMLSQWKSRKYILQLTDDSYKKLR